MAKKVFIGFAALIVVLAMVSRGGSLLDDADARVDIDLAGDVDVDQARASITSEATRSWRATRVAESSESDHEATVEFALPGASLDGFIEALRRHPDAAAVEVSLEVDPDQMEPVPLDSAAGETSPEPVRVQVNLAAQQSQGPMVTIIGALIVALLAAGSLALLWRRFGDGVFSADGDDVVSEADLHTGEPEIDQDRRRRWTQRP